MSTHSSTRSAPRRHDGRAGRISAAAAALVAVAVAGVLASRAAHPKPEPCPDGHYLVDGPPLLDGVAAAPATAVTIANGRIALDGSCPAQTLKAKVKRRGTLLKARWPICEGVVGAVRLSGRIEPACQRLTARVLAKRHREKFTAIRSTCGDGVVDPDAGEACDGAVGCAPPASCSSSSACVGGTTTTTPGGTTTTTAAVGTTTTTPGSTTTSVTSVTATTTTVTTTSSAPTTTLPIVPGPDPTTVATPLQGGSTTSFADATAFLYAGPTPVQFNVAPDAVVSERAAVVRGLVLDAQGAPLVAVLVGVLDHPELGQTLSRSDGAFDLVVDGGGLLTLAYRKSGFLPVERQLDVPWQDYVRAPDVRLCPLDAQATQVDLATANDITIARGSEKTDADGTRQATLLIAPGTTAEMVMPDGSTHPLSQLTVRATEFTVGTAGPEMMPAALPPTSGYTYAVEFSADEAIQSGATMVRFDRPIPTYVENFPGFPAGTPVPAGFYDYERAAWVAAPDGRVIDVVGITGALADLDVSGDGVADAGPALTALGIDDAERAKLATLYAPGTSLWRVPVDHFTPWDYNWPYGPPGDADTPQNLGADARSDDDPIGGTCEAEGSVIECENQVLGEDLVVAGTPYTLHYRSNRVPGRMDALDVTVSGPTVPSSLLGIRVRATIAGRTTDQSFPPNPNQSIAIAWDGTDAYGRPVQGGVRALGSIDYVYPAVFRTPEQVAQSFALFGGTQLSASRSTSTVTASQPFNVVLREGLADARGLGLGGWTLGVHHFYDPVSHVLELGTGERRRAEEVSRIIETVKSGGGMFDIAVGADGRLYILGSDNRIRRRDPDGTETVIAGKGGNSIPADMDFGDDGPATEAFLIGPTRMVTAPDGSLYVVDNSVVRRIGPDGIIRRIAGTYSFEGTPCDVPDGAIARDARLCVDDLAVGADGTLYFAEFPDGNRVRRVGPDGVVVTVAGGGGLCDLFGNGICGDGGPAESSQLMGGNRHIGLAPDGTLYLTDANRIRKVRRDGVITAFAGQIFAQEGGSLEGDDFPAGPGTKFCNPYDFAFAADGALLVADLGNNRIRRIAPDGIVGTIVGSGQSCVFSNVGQSGDLGPALQAVMSAPRSIVVAPNGDIFALAGGPLRIRRIHLPLPGFDDTDIPIASEDGRSLYAFDRNGRHLRTFDALTGAIRREFGYDAAGRLVQVVEKTGGTDNVTTIEHDAQGNPTAIVGPFGKRTTLATDGNGFLASLTNPAGETTAFASTASGLLTGLTAPGNRTSTFAYDAAGRLLDDDDPGAGEQTLVRSGPANAFTVTRTTALGRATTYEREQLVNRRERRTVTFPDGTSAIVTANLDAATRTTEAPSGTILDAKAGGDPRFRLQAPVATSVSLRFPSGLVSTATNTRTASVSDPANLLSLVSLAETSTVAGNTYATAYTAATRTFVTTSPLGRTRTLALDALGRPVSLQASGGVATTTTYDARGRIASIATGSQTPRTFSFTYDAQGLPAAVTDPLGRTVGMERDAAGRLTRKTLPDGSQVTIAFNAAGDVASLTPPGQPAHTFGYDARGKLVSITPPGGTGASTLTYDSDGALASVARPNETVTFAYDAAGRTVAIGLDVQGGPQGSYGITYDGATGLPTHVTGPGGAATDYSYDGGLVTGIAWSGPVAGTLEVVHDERLAVTSETVNGTSTVTFAHDADDHLVAAGDLAIGRDATTGLPATTALGVVTDASIHDAFGELVQYTASANGSPIYDETFEYDALGRVVRRVETVGGVAHTWDYAYDLNGELIEVRRDGVGVESYAYDANGNRTAATVGGSSVTAAYDAQDRLVTYGTASFTYTPSGRLATKTTPGGTTTYTYDAAGNLLAVALPGGADVAYALDPGMRRVARDVNGVAAERFLWSGNRPIAQLDDMGAIVSRFVYGGGPAPAYLVRNGIAHRLIADHAGSVRLVVDAATGAIVQRLDYDAFGRVTLDTNPGFQPFGFAGGLYDALTGLVRFDARDYDAVTGRFTAKDPIGFAGGDTNLYRYAHNDPVNLSDPEGLTVAEIATGILTGLVDVAMLPATLAHQAAVLGAALTEAITGVPQPVPPDPNPVVGAMDALNQIADEFFDAEPLVDMDSTAFQASRICTSVLAELGAGLAGGAGAAAEAAGTSAVRPALQAGGRAAANTADPAYRPLASAAAARAERLAAENARRVAQQEARQVGEQVAEQNRLELVRPEGGGAGTRGANKAAGGFGLGR